MFHTLRGCQSEKVSFFNTEVVSLQIFTRIFFLDLSSSHFFICINYFYAFYKLNVNYDPFSKIEYLIQNVINQIGHEKTTELIGSSIELFYSSNTYNLV